MAADIVAGWIASDKPHIETWHLFLTTLVVACVAVLYCALSLVFSFEGLPFLPIAIADTLFLIPIVVIIALLDKNNALSTTSCYLSSQNAKNASGFASSLESDTSLWSSNSVTVSAIVNSGTSLCRQIKAIWAFYIALSILFFVTLVSNLIMWMRGRRKNGKSLA
ncbi:MAG: hypothetical protein MMC23_003424 [Stictis urceolatum]|nr:hypothetical protein [Stictis urceolata]